MFCADVKAHFSVPGGYRLYSWVVVKRYFYKVNASIDYEFIVLLSIVNLDVAGAISKLSNWTIL